MTAPTLSIATTWIAPPASILVQPKENIATPAVYLAADRMSTVHLRKDTVYNALPDAYGGYQVYSGIYLTHSIPQDRFNVVETKDSALAYVLFLSFVLLLVSLPFWLPQAIKKVTGLR